MFWALCCLSGASTLSLVSFCCIRVFVLCLCFWRLRRVRRRRRRSKERSHDAPRLRRSAMTATFLNFGLHIFDCYFCQPPVGLREVFDPDPNCPLGNLNKVKGQLGSAHQGDIFFTETQCIYIRIADACMRGRWISCISKFWILACCADACDARGATWGPS